MFPSPACEQCVYIDFTETGDTLQPTTRSTTSVHEVHRSMIRDSSYEFIEAFDDHTEMVDRRLANAAH